MRFSKEQSVAIMHTDGPMMVIAGPGSGKTTVITRRIKYLIESAGVSPADILVITFTKAAATEMEQRFKAITQGESYQVRFGTFHSIFFWIIKRAYGLDNSSVINETEKRNMLDGIVKSMSVEHDNREDVISSIMSQIGLVKCNMIDIDNYYSSDMPEEYFREIYKRFEHEMKRAGKIDFDDMMVMCYELLIKRPDILNQLRNVFKYILVDEFQDSNKLQYEILKLLSKPAENVFIVGDDDQSVYGFRGAKPEIMQAFTKDFNKVKITYLSENYRCGKSISAASIKVISENSNRFKKKLVSAGKSDGIVKIIHPMDARDESLLIIKSLKEHYNMGIPYEQQAVLYRTNNEPRILVYRLNEFNIPFTISDSMPNIFEHFVVKNILDYIKMALGDRSRSTFLRIMNKPSRYISRDILWEETIDFNKLMERLHRKEYVVENLYKLEADLRLIVKMKPYAALNFIRKSVGYDGYIKDYCEYRQMDSAEFYDLLDTFAGLIQDMTSFGEMFEFIDNYTEVIKTQQKHSKDRNGVNLMTMHSSKGLEFQAVHIIEAVDGITPYKKAKTKAEKEEERRMFYVAMTRAKEELYIYCPRTVLGKEKKVSPFVKVLENK
ncbi:MAG: ATP-dependent helicase [Lachnospiraceae bacterium]|nr:ATP-dependent helicase [Lachnospiraceae bacterium]